MARTPEYDKKQVMIAAAQAFASYGYAGCSIDRLVAATGLQRGSLYQAFGSKAGLFHDSLAGSAMELRKAAHSGTDLACDMVIVAMLERAATDRRVRELVGEIISELVSHSDKSIQHLLYARLKKRAGI